MAAAISSGAPIRAIGMRDILVWCSAALVTASRCTRSVLIRPGLTAFTAMP